MTYKEALQAQSEFISNVSDGVLDFHLSEFNLVGSDTYTTENRKEIDLAFAGLILFIATQPKSIRELDWQITNHDVSDLLKIRSGLLAKWGISDGSQPKVRAYHGW